MGCLPSHDLLGGEGKASGCGQEKQQHKGEEEREKVRGEIQRNVQSRYTETITEKGGGQVEAKEEGGEHRRSRETREAYRGSTSGKEKEV